MTKHFAISRWELTGELFVSSLIGCASAVEAAARAQERAERCEEQTFSHTIEADNFNHAQAILRGETILRGEA